MASEAPEVREEVPVREEVRERAVHANRGIEPSAEVEASHVSADEGGLRATAGLLPRHAHHAGRCVDARDLVTPTREFERVISGPAPEVEDRDGSTPEKPREHPLQEVALRGIVDVVVQDVVILRDPIEVVPRHVSSLPHRGSPRSVPTEEGSARFQDISNPIHVPSRGRRCERGKPRHCVRSPVRW